MAVQDAIRYTRQIVLRYASADLVKCFEFEDAPAPYDVTWLSGWLAKAAESGEVVHGLPSQARRLRGIHPHSMGLDMAARQVEVTAARLAAIDAAEDLVRRAEHCADHDTDSGLWQGAACLLLAGAVPKGAKEGAFIASLLQQTGWAVQPVARNASDALASATELFNGALDSAANPVLAGADYD